MRSRTKELRDYDTVQLTHPFFLNFFNAVSYMFLRNALSYNTLANVYMSIVIH